jgi:hypothetical protein
LPAGVSYRFVGRRCALAVSGRDRLLDAEPADRLFQTISLVN